jgi:uncharacterized protein DUF4255
MSTPAAIAAVTAVLKDLLENGMIETGATTAVGNVTVTAQAPDRIKVPEEQSQLNLFLYLVTPNLGWRNADMPTRDTNGDLVNAPLLALDLHYLVSAYGARDFHAEILLGYAMQLLNETPVLTRGAIRLAMQPSGAVNGSTSLPPDLQDLSTSGLADQIEMIKIAPSYLTTDEMFKLWMAFQAPYRPTAGYHVSVVLIESASKGKAAPPVRERMVYAVPFRHPVVQEVLSQAPAPPDAPFLPDQPILAGYRLALVGQQLKGGLTQVLLDGAELPAAQVQVADTRIVFALPADLPAGVHTVQVSQKVPMGLGTPPPPHRGVESQAVPFVLCPAITAPVTADVTGGAGPDTPRKGTVTVKLAPPVGASQRVTLLLNELLPAPPPPHTQPAKAYRFAVPPNQPGVPDPTNTLQIDFDGVLPATYLVRVQVDGAESPLSADKTAGRYADPQVVIP